MEWTPRDESRDYKDSVYGYETAGFQSSGSGIGTGKSSGDNHQTAATPVINSTAEEATTILRFIEETGVLYSNETSMTIAESRAYVRGLLIRWVKLLTWTLQAI